MSIVNLCSCSMPSLCLAQVRVHSLSSHVRGMLVPAPNQQAQAGAQACWLQTACLWRVRGTGLDPSPLLPLVEAAHVHHACQLQGRGWGSQALQQWAAAPSEACHGLLAQ